MCDRHNFQFDVDKAYEDQLAFALEDTLNIPSQNPKPVRGPVSTFFFALVYRFMSGKRRILDRA